MRTTRRSLALCTLILSPLSLLSLLAANYGVVNFHESPKEGGKATKPSSGIQIPDGYTFTPSIAERPLASNAIMTMCTGNFTPSANPLEIDDDYCLQSMIHSYLLLHREYTKIQPEDDAEYAIVVTDETPRPCIKAFLLLGARVITVPLTEVPDSVYHTKKHPRYAYTFTKLRMWGLGGVYAKIMFHDSDVFFFRRSPVRLFDVLDDKAAVNPHFAVTPELEGIPDFNAGLMIFRPNATAYRALLELVPENLHFGDQGVLVKYYRESWTPLPRIWNMLHFYPFASIWKLENRIAAALALHHKFWLSSFTQNYPETRKAFHLYSDAAVELRRFQIQLIESEGHWDVPVAPVIPRNSSLWFELQKSRFKFTRVALIPASRHDSVVDEWKQMAYVYAQMSVIPVPLDVNLDTASILTFCADALHGSYDWIWIVGDTVRPNLGNTVPVQLTLDRWTTKTTRFINVIDCSGAITNSAFIHRGVLSRILTHSNTTSSSKLSDYASVLESDTVNNMDLFQKLAR
ncbi:nucleotide-diphospho-sugar transferase [Chytriomyces sp. MP71]|nr:nucleotide-diphospho-sugar transferase [Chytriomyces sp. MP71]